MMERLGSSQRTQPGNGPVEQRRASGLGDALGMEVVSNKRNKASRALADAPGKSVDRWVAVLRRKQA